MDRFVFSRDKKTDNPITASRTAAAHTAQNLRPHEPETSNITVGHLHTPQPKKSFKEWLRSLTKKQWIIIGSVAAVLLIGGGTGLFLLLKKDAQPVVQEPPKQQQTAPTPEPTTVASNLTGLQVDKNINERPVTAVMIENSVEARPQAGLNQAGVIFEAVAEGSITRFVALFQDSEPDYVGPVRSVRPYYVQWMLGFDAAIAHAGGSPDGLNMISQTKAKDLNHNSSYFWRVNNRVQPHNLYTSIAKLREYESQKGYGKANFTALPRKEKEEPAAAVAARTIDFNVSSANYNVHYDYDPGTNSYKRSEGGKAHTDEKSGSQLTPKVVVALIVPQGKNGVYTTYNVIGSGQVVVFQDGISTEGTWKKESNNTNLTLTDSSGKELKLNPGQTWFTALGGRDRVTFKP